MNKKDKELFVKEEQLRELDLINSRLNVNESDKKKFPGWLAPLLIILLLLIALVFFLPRYIQNKSKSELEDSRVIQDEFLLNADAIVSSKYARLYDIPSFDGNPITSVLYNEPLKLTTNSENNGFYAVETYDGVQGYIQKTKLSFDLSSILSDTIIDRLIIINGDKMIASDTANGNIIDVAPMGSVLYADYVTEQTIRIVLPNDEIGWINRESVVVFSLNENIPTASENQADIFASSALKFLNVAYMPAGLTLEGIDVPGIIYLTGLTNGLELPRLLEEQAESGYQISFEKDSSGIPYLEGFKVGDLLFFSDLAGDNLDSVGIFLGEDNLLYAHGTQNKIEIISLTNNEKLFKRLEVVRRLFD